MDSPHYGLTSCPTAIVGTLSGVTRLAGHSGVLSPAHCYWSHLLLLGWSLEDCLDCVSCPAHMPATIASAV